MKAFIHKKKAPHKYVETVRDNAVHLMQLVFVEPNRYVKDGKATEHLYRLSKAFAVNIHNYTNFNEENAKNIFLINAVELARVEKEAEKENKSIKFHLYEDFAEKVTDQIYKAEDVDRKKVFSELLSTDVSIVDALSNTLLNSIYPLLNEEVQKKVAKEVLKRRLNPTFVDRIRIYDNRENITYEFYFKNDKMFISIDGKEPRSVDMPVSYKAISPFFDLMSKEEKSLFSLANKVYRTLNMEKDPVYSIISEAVYSAFNYEGNEVDAVQNLEAEAKKKVEKVDTLSSSAKKSLLNAVKDAVFQSLNTNNEMQLEEIADNTYQSFLLEIENLYNDIPL